MRPSGVSSTDAEHDLALATADRIVAWLSEQGFPAPVRADSGNGAHLLYRVDLPNDEVATGLVKGCLATLDVLFSNEKVTVDTANHNAARIWKLYGTVSRKGDNTAERPHRRSRLLTVPDEIGLVPVERLAHLAGLLPADEPPAPKKGGGIDLAAWLPDHGIAVRSAKPYRGGTLYTLEDCPFSSAHKDGAFAIQFASGAIFAGCHHQSCGSGTQRWPELRARYEQREPKRKEEISNPPSPPAEYRQRAMEILENGDPLAFLLDTFTRTHVGDRIVAECLIMSLASQSIENTSGLHVAISGNSGKGKTHACNAMLNLVPEEYRLKGTVSNKALFYHDSLRSGTVLLFDDVSLSDDLQELLKSATANFREPIEHRTLTADRRLRVCTIPERCVWWLAKVESVGDDQVMNRMLTVWIDDSKEQDIAVLEHVKKVEARSPDTCGEDVDVLVCRALWEILKGQQFHIHIPFSPRIHFSNAANRRNPAMLFDLIKCHALLHFRRRERDDHGSLIATRQDFAYARQLFIAINGEVGGQETKQTRNEAAALATVAKMGIAVFTIRQLQDTLGLSYHQTYRLLHGYTNSKATYTGILDKCPAVSLIDATVVEELYGLELKRREQYFSFDYEIYRQWSARAEVWIAEEDGATGNRDDPGSDVCTFAPRLHPKIGKSANQKNVVSRVYSCNEVQYKETCTGTPVIVHPSGEPQNLPDDAGSGCSDGCESRMSANVDDIRAPQPSFPYKTPERRVSDCTPGCKGVQTGANVQSKTGKVLPLPGLLDHRTFERARVDLGRCTICDTAKAVYHSREARASICQGCYARLVREWNREEGVR